MVLAAAGAAATGAGFAGAVAWMNRWGSSASERVRPLPGDGLIPGPAGQTTMALNVDADPERVWRWLVQIGQDRGGMYSYDRLEQLIGLDIRSATSIRPEWQRLEVGDRIQLVPAGWGPLPDGYAFRVAAMDPPNSLVLRQGPEPWDGVWSFTLKPLGPGRCQLVSRTRTKQRPGIGGALARAASSIGVPVTWFMTRRMLLTLKARAESGSEWSSSCEQRAGRASAGLRATCGAVQDDVVHG